MSQSLTDKQLETLKAIEKFISENGMPPTLLELQSMLGVSSNQAIINHLTALEEKGHIQRKKTARGIKILKSIAEYDDKNEFLDILAEIAAKKKNQSKQEPKITSPSPFLAEESTGKVIVGFYNDEQY